MGIESDQLVYDYLSRVGDLAQQAQLPSGARMRLVASLRSEIDAQRAKSGGDSPAGVRRIIGRLGTPDEVVASAASGDEEGPAEPRPSRPPRPTGAAAAPEPVAGSAMPKQRGRRRVPRPRAGGAPPPAVPFAGASPPHLAGMHELGPSGSEPDWWRVAPLQPGASDSVAGFVGGVEIPEILKPPPSEEEAEADGHITDGAEDPAEPAAGRRGLIPRLRRRGEAVEGAPRAGVGSPVLLLAAALLVAGAVLGSLIALGLGWLVAYGSRRLSRAEVKLAVLGLPGAAAAAGALWLWGRVNGHWGEPIPAGGMRDVLAGTWPWVLKGAATASALFLVWRGRRTR